MRIDELHVLAGRSDELTVAGTVVVVVVLIVNLCESTDELYV